MKTLATVLTVITLGLALAGAAEAAVLYSLPLQNLDSTGQYLNCVIVNVSSVSRDFTIEIFRNTEVIATGGGPSSGTLDPGKTSNELTTDTAARYCKITWEGGKSTVRASFCREETGVGAIACVPVE